LGGSERLALRTHGRGQRRFYREDLEAFPREQADALPRAAKGWTDIVLHGSPLEIQGQLFRARDRLGAWHAVGNELGVGLAEIGMRWARGEITVIQEHIATENLSRALERAVEAIPCSARAARCLLATAEDDVHTLGLSLVELCLREAGWARSGAGATHRSRTWPTSLAAVTSTCSQCQRRQPRPMRSNSLARRRSSARPAARPASSSPSVVPARGQTLRPTGLGCATCWPCTFSRRTSFLLITRGLITGGTTLGAFLCALVAPRSAFAGGVEAEFEAGVVAATLARVDRSTSRLTSEAIELRAGYRMLEGGADNDEVYSFAWLHYATLGVGLYF
jgi:hypothetical protein